MCIRDRTQSTIEANARFFRNEGEVPKQALTIGMGTILKAKKIILVANGDDKEEAIHRLWEDTSLRTDFPVSFLRLHPDVTIITTIK